MRRIVGRVVLGAIALALCMQAFGWLSAAPVAAQTVSWQTPFVIQNLDTRQANYIQVTFFGIPSGAAIHTMNVGPLAVGKSVAVRPWSIAELPAGQYSVAIDADAKVGAIVNQQSNPAAGSYIGGVPDSAGSTSVSFPNIVRNYVGWHSPFYVQNAGLATTTVTVTFYRFSDGGQVAQVSKSLLAGQSWEIDPASVPGTADGTQYAVVAKCADQPLVGIANQLSGSVEMTYSGFARGGMVAYMPNITRNYVGWNTPFIVQNVGNGDTAVTARYYKFSDGSLARTDGPYTLGAGKSIPFRPQYTSGLVDGTQYSVVVDSNSQPIVSVVNEQAGNVAMSYTGFAKGGLKSHLPNITRNYVGWNTPFIVQNVGGGQTTITVEYYRFGDGSLAKSEGPYTLGAGKSQAFRPQYTAGLADGSQYSVIVKSTSQPIVSVVNEHAAQGDAMAYEGMVGD